MRGHYDAALADLCWVIERHPERADALLYRGAVFMTKGDDDRALVDFERAASSRPGWLRPALLYERGQCYAAKGDFDRAIADVTDVIAAYPSKVILYKFRAACYHKKGDLDYAVADYDEIVRFQPHDPEAYIMRFNVLLQKGDMDRAMADVDRLVNLLPDSSGPYFFLAVVSLVTSGDRQKALADMDRAVSMNPRASFLYVLRGFIHVRDGKLNPTCRDLGLFALTFRRSEYSFSAKMDWKAQRFDFVFGFHAKDPTNKPEQKAVVSDFNRKCIDLGFQQLLVAAFNSRR